MADPSEFLRLGRIVMRRDGDKAEWPPSTAERRRFKSFFGVGPEICLAVFSLVVEYFSLVDAEPLHFLWALMMLKVY